MKWLFELDYDADPDDHPDDVREDVIEELEHGLSGDFVRDSMIVFTDTQDAFKFRLRFGHHVTRIEQMT